MTEERHFGLDFLPGGPQSGQQHWLGEAAVEGSVLRGGRNHVCQSDTERPACFFERNICGRGCEARARCEGRIAGRLRILFAA